MLSSKCLLSKFHIQYRQKKPTALQKNDWRVHFHIAVVVPPLPNSCDPWGQDPCEVTALIFQCPPQGTHTIHSHLTGGASNLTNVQVLGLWEQTTESPCRYVGTCKLDIGSDPGPSCYGATALLRSSRGPSADFLPLHLCRILLCNLQKLTSASYLL